MVSKRVAPLRGRRQFHEASATILRVSTEAPGDRSHGAGFRLAALAAILVIPAWTLRYLALRELGLSQGATLFRGFAADLAVALCFLVAILVVARWRRWAAVAVAAFWVLLQYANYEHVLALDAPLSFTYAGYLLDPTFLLGSGVALSHPFLLLFLLVAVGVSTRLVLKRPFRGRAITAATLLALAACGALWMWPANPQVLAWKRSHFLIDEIRRHSPVGEASSPTTEPSRAIT
jgi:hypothetical protein